MKNQTILAGDLHKYGFSQADNVYSTNGIAPTVTAHLGGQIGHQIQIVVYEDCEDVRLSEADSR